MTFATCVLIIVANYLVYLARVMALSKAQRMNKVAQANIYATHMFFFLLFTYCAMPEVSKKVMGGLLCAKIPKLDEDHLYLVVQPHTGS